MKTSASLAPVSCEDVENPRLPVKKERTDRFWINQDTHLKESKSESVKLDWQVRLEEMIRRKSDEWRHESTLVDQEAKDWITSGSIQRKVGVVCEVTAVNSRPDWMMKECEESRVSTGDSSGINKTQAKMKKRQTNRRAWTRLRARECVCVCERERKRERKRERERERERRLRNLQKVWKPNKTVKDLKVGSKERRMEETGVRNQQTFIWSKMDDQNGHWPTV